MKQRLYVLSVAFLLASFLSGCASIVSRSIWPVSVQTNPTGAECLISKVSGAPLHTGKTPITLNLDASSAPFWPATYKVKCSKDGYQTSSSEISAYINGWYFGNIMLGGVLGMLIVDPLTGAMWRLSDTHIVNLVEDKSIFNISSQNLISEKTALPAKEASRKEGSTYVSEVATQPNKSDDSLQLEEEWWISINGQKYGSFKTSKIKELLSSGKITDNTYVWKEGMANWKKISDSPFARTIGTPTQKISNINVEEHNAEKEIVVYDALKDAGKVKKTVAPN